VDADKPLVVISDKRKKLSCVYSIIKQAVYYLNNASKNAENEELAEILSNRT
jgi:hypothetical protein